jgi:dTDP-4-dehydrorhamnose 3,5-epimerase-like enzyme
MDKQIDLKRVGFPDVGYLSVFEDRDISFPIRRLYYIHSVPEGVQRGFHAHKNLQQFAFCPYGDITMILDDGKSRKEIQMNNPSIGVHIGSGIWREMLWNKADSVLCVVASEYYDESDYIRDYDEFLRLVKEGYWNEKP